MGMFSGERRVVSKQLLFHCLQVGIVVLFVRGRRSGVLQNSQMERLPLRTPR